MGNTKNPTIVWLNRMATAKDGQGTLAALMTKYFRDNYGFTSLPKTVADYAIYDQQPLAAGVTRLFQGTYSPARSNWPNGNNFIAAESEHMIIQSIKAYDCIEALATIDSGDWQPGISDAIAKNATFDATINGQRVLTGIPLTVFDSNASGASFSGATNDDRGRFYLMEPLVVLGQTGIQININLNAGKTPTQNYNIRFELEGQRFIGN
jgi:hypothetical protein